MTVWVDATRRYSPSGPSCFGRGSCHMIADSDEELRAMAALIGLRREWEQSPGPHYDLTPQRRALAILRGAVSVSCRELMAKLRATDSERESDPRGRTMNDRAEKALSAVRSLRIMAMAAPPHNQARADQHEELLRQFILDAESERRERGTIEREASAERGSSENAT